MSGVFMEYSADIHKVVIGYSYVSGMYRVCVGYVSRMYRVCIGIFGKVEGKRR